MIINKIFFYIVYNIYIMTDYINKDVPVANGTTEGPANSHLYDWMSIRAGGDSALSKLSVIQPINLNSGFLYNGVGITSASVFVQDNDTASAVGAGYVPVVPAANPYLNEITPSAGLTTTLAEGIVTNTSGGAANYNVYYRVLAYSAPNVANGQNTGAGDVYNVALFDGVNQVAVSNHAVAGYLGGLTIFEGYHTFNALANNGTIRIQSQNTTSITRGLVAVSVKLVARVV
jgi:hypothetical protein